ncbi:energy-coupling factor ABC transporter ATP-binding protein [Priestia taiwanensis]|uniref:Energy-coupling factor transporter ATP-binding protein EcfA1 n=1 Tax=Priestia taiwanensis TaxID=1347902 RepID=A0A917AWM8_9BACI|nr:energy-coupling factor ABC transporter ATP-binding protein [Priestia taiwanensis]MBM7365089.1 energy-coupling factor transport system ATP-binding protein [Priestia taiwanensis]GGE84339.1 energy-coupling factor transporter ATP-binding protein EcfA1 [Priestia taiwanensis]
MKKEQLRVENISFTYPSRDTSALEEVSFSLYENEWLAIIGPNGSGKSTMSKIINGLLLPSSGTVTVGEDLLLSEDTVWDIREKIGIVFQNPDNQFVGTTVIDDLAFGLENLSIPREEMVRRIPRVLEQVGMTGFEDAEPHLLSGGQKQRVAIAGILAMQPSIIILDEATSMLDPKGRMEVMKTVRALKEEMNLSVISITHDLEEAMHADRILVLHNGKKIDEGTPSEIFEQAKMLQEIGLDVPFAVKLSASLREEGINIGANHLSMEGVIEALCKLHSTK